MANLIFFILGCVIVSLALEARERRKLEQEEKKLERERKKLEQEKKKLERGTGTKRRNILVS